MVFMENAFLIINNNPTFFKQADQWSEDGYVFYNGFVHEYEIDRKDGSAHVFPSMTLDEFILRPEASAEEKEWAISFKS